MLPARYEHVRDELKVQLSCVQYCALTCDLWTSRQALGYITVTCHFIDSSWVLKSAVLVTTNVTNDHTAENIAEELNADNAANIVAAVQLNGWRHIPCFAHTLNLVVQDSLAADPPLSCIQRKCRDIVSYFHRSSKATERLNAIQTRLNLDKHKLIQDVQTRWNSTYYMFERIIEQNEAIATTLCMLNRNELCLSEDEISKIKQAVVLLHPLESATREMSSDKYISLSKVIPIAKSLQQLTASGESSLSLRQHLLTQMNRRFLNIESNSQLALACLLDPRFKKMAFSDAAALEEAYRRLVNEMAGLKSTTPDPEDIAGSSSSSSQGDTRPITENPLWKQFDQRVRASMSQRTLGVDVTVEKQQYLQHKNIDRHEDPLQWWKQNSFHLPQLQDLAKKYLCIPGTSVPSERLFSKAGEVVAARRSAIKPKNVDMILFLNKNLE